SAMARHGASRTRTAPRTEIHPGHHVGRCPDAARRGCRCAYPGDRLAGPRSAPARRAGGWEPSQPMPGGSMATRHKVGYFIGSLSSTSINRRLSKALIKLAPAELTLEEISFRELPLYSQDHDANYPPVARAFKQAILESDAILFITPEYNRSIPGGLKNAIDWASRPYGQNAFARKPTAVIGASIGAIGTALAQQSLRGVLAFCDAPQMT